MTQNHAYIEILPIFKQFLMAMVDGLSKTLLTKAKSLCFHSWLQGPFYSQNIFYTFGKNHFVFKENLSQICKNPFALKKSTTLFQISEIPLGWKMGIKAASVRLKGLSSTMILRVLNKHKTKSNPVRWC